MENSFYIVRWNPSFGQFRNVHKLGGGNEPLKPHNFGTIQGIYMNFMSLKSYLKVLDNYINSNTET